MPNRYKGVCTQLSPTIQNLCAQLVHEVSLRGVDLRSLTAHIRRECILIMLGNEVSKAEAARKLGYGPRAFIGKRFQCKG